MQMQNSSSESRLLHSLGKQYMHISSTVKLNNGVEKFYSHFNEQCYATHQSCFMFIDAAKQLQATTYKVCMIHHE